MSLFYARCTADSDDCGWTGDRRTESPSPCPWCGAAVEYHEPTRRRVLDHNGPSASELGLVRPAEPSTPFGIPRASPRLRPRQAGTLVLPNGLRAKIVRMPELSEAFDEPAWRANESVSEVLTFTTWHNDA